MHSLQVETHDLPLGLDQAASTYVHRYLVEGVCSKICFGAIALGLTSGWMSQHQRTSGGSFLKAFSWNVAHSFGGRFWGCCGRQVFVDGLEFFPFTILLS